MELSEHVLEPLREDEEFILYRNHPRQTEAAVYHPCNSATRTRAKAFPVGKLCWWIAASRRILICRAQPPKKPLTKRKRWQRVRLRP